MKHLTTKELPESERPYERCEKYGAGILTDSELLAIIIRSGTQNERSIDLAYKILNIDPERYGINILNHISYKELVKIKGIGRVKAVQLLSVAELAKRISLEVRRDGIYLNSADAVAGFFMEKMRHLEREQTRVVFLDMKMKMIADKVLFEGTVGMAPMEPREILREALRVDAVFFILLHNHPSGDPTPSDTDIRTTKRIIDAADAVGIRLKDHIIIGDNKFVSLKAYGAI